MAKKSIPQSKNPARVAAGRKGAATVAKKRRVARATGIAIGILSAGIMQAHGLPVWLEYGGYLTVAAVMCIDAAILYMASRGGAAAMFVAALGMLVVIAGPLYAIADPVVESFSAMESATIRLQELPDVENAILEGEKAVETMYKAQKITLAQPLVTKLEQARAKKAALLNLQASEVNDTKLTRDTAFAALHGILILIMQLSACVCVRLARN